jgi:hypothetical protein
MKANPALYVLQGHISNALKFTLQNLQSHICHLRNMESSSQMRSSGKLEGGRWLAHTHELSVSHIAVIRMSKPGYIITDTVTHLPRVSE